MLRNGHMQCTMPERESGQESLSALWVLGTVASDEMNERAVKGSGRSRRVTLGLQAESRNVYQSVMRIKPLDFPLLQACHETVSYKPMTDTLPAMNKLQ